jgi:hypothetical protein
MKFKIPVNKNYCGTIVKIDNIHPLDKCDNVQGSVIFGEQVIISKQNTIDEIGIYFPPETQLSNEFLKNNNLYRDPTLNLDPTQKGYFELNGRIRTVKFRGHKSVGFWIPLKSLEFTKFPLEDFEVGDEFDVIKEIEICKKYIPKRNISSNNNSRSRRKIRRQTKEKLVENQFRFHPDTAQFAKNLWRFSKKDIISITYKLHGTSVVITKLLCNKKLNLFYKILKLLRIKVQDTQYDNIYSSRKVIKNNFSDITSYYNEDIWGMANKKIEPYLKAGMSIYAEIVGYLPSGEMIQKQYDYGCNQNEFEVYIYRITYTNLSGDCFEFSFKQIEEWCKERGLKTVPLLYYGTIDNFLNIYFSKHDEDEHLMKYFLERLQKVYLEKDCYMCKNKVPAEGIVIRPERLEFEAYKLKSVKFLEWETKQLDTGEIDIETDPDENKIFE